MIRRIKLEFIMQIINYLLYYSLMTTKQACWNDLVVLIVFFYSLVPHRRVVVIVRNGRGLEIIVNVALPSPQNEATLK